MTEPSTTITYQVQYQEKGNSDWYIMTRRNHDERFRSEVKYGMHELSDAKEAIEVAEALANGTAHPHKPDAYYWRPIVAAQWTTIIRTEGVSAVYGTPNGDVPRETTTGETS